MNVLTALNLIFILTIILLLSSWSYGSLNQAQGQVSTLPVCPDGYQRSPNGVCEPDLDLPSLPRCPNGYQRSPLGICEPTSLTNFQNCPVGYQVNVNGFCVPVTGSQSVNPYGYPTTSATVPQSTLSQPSTSTSTGSLISPTPSLTNPSTAQMSPWFPSLPAIACGGTSTMTTIGSVESDSDSGDNNDNNNGGDDDDDDDKKDYAFQIESDGGPSADPESVDGKVYAGEKNIERNNGKDFDIKDVFNDCQVSMFNND